MGEGHFIVMK